MKRILDRIDPMATIPADRAPTQRPTAIEWWLVAALFLIGFALRAAWPSHLAVEHFDEGVYASNIFFLDDAATPQYPDQHLYAPPLLPRLIELAMVLLGPSNVAAMAVNIVAGSLTVPLMWWVGRRWFGATAGLASATLVALNDVHIFFSRTALTDALLCFWLVAAVYFIQESLTTGRWLAIFAAGVTTGLAWWTKYNGWLPLAIGLAGLVPWRLQTDGRQIPGGLAPRLSVGRKGRALAGSLGCWLAIALIALVAWSPWVWSLQDKGGYSAVQRNHRGYLVGVSGWLDSLAHFAAKLGVLDGWLNLHAPLFAVAVCLVHHRFSTRRSTWNVLYENQPLLIGMLVLFGLGIVSSASIVIGIASALGIVWGTGFCDWDFGFRISNWFGFARIPNPKSQIRNPSFEGRAPTGSGSGMPLAGWLLAAWYTGLFLTTPLYTPYPRLTLPWLTACWLGAGLLVGKAISPREDPANRSVGRGTANRLESAPGRMPEISPAQRSRGAATLLAVSLVCASLEPFITQRRVPGWEPRTGLAAMVPGIMNAIQSTPPLSGRAGLDDFVIYTYGEPAALFQLRLAGVRWVRAVKDLKFADPAAPPPRLASFLVFGRRARLTPGFAAEVLDRKGRLQLVRHFSHAQSELVTLDDSADFEMPRDELSELFEVK